MIDDEIEYLVVTAAIISVCTFSTICLIIHFYKFFKAPSPQSLSTKNLTFYCFFLLLIYLITFVYVAMPETDFISLYLVSIMAHLIATTTFIKFIIAFDLFTCFRKVAIYLQAAPSLGTQNRKFIIYCVLGTCLPLLYQFICITWADEVTDYDDFSTYFTPFNVARIIRVTRLFLIIGAFWYIRKASMGKKQLWSKYGLHMRLLAMLGGFSAAISIYEVYDVINQELDSSLDQDEARQVTTLLYLMIQYLGVILEGAVIAVLFTFRKETFQPTTTGLPTQQAIAHRA